MCFDRSLGIGVSHSVHFDVDGFEQEPITSHRLPEVLAGAMRRHPYDMLVNGVVEGRDHEKMDSGKRVLVTSSPRPPSVCSLHTRLAVDHERGAWLGPQSSLIQSPGLSTGDVLDPCRRNTIGKGHDMAIFIDDDERPAISGSEGRRPVKAGAIAVDGSYERATRGLNDPLERRFLLRGGGFAAGCWALRPSRVAGRCSC